ncbi:MAG: hypothetical protein LRS43_04740, partial [Desulfurococcales archaeon]|nr:hypothetical protein [Desulfurococcales archaeon]
MGSSRAVTGIQPYVTALILVLALAATLPGSDTGLLRVAKASSGSSFEVTVSQAGSGLRVTVLFNGEPLLSLSIYEKALDNTTYDYVINYVVEPPGRRLDPFTVLHYALASGQEKARGSLYLEDGAWATLSMLAKGMTLANVTIKELGVSVTVKTPGEGHESTYVSLLEILREHHLPGWFVKGFRSVWFEAIPSVVRDQWVDVRLRGAMGDLGFIRVTSQGPFNETLKVRILV